MSSADPSDTALASRPDGVPVRRSAYRHRPANPHGDLPRCQRLTQLGVPGGADLRAGDVTLSGDAEEVFERTSDGSADVP
jgi:hypothetical protein